MILRLSSHVVRGLLVLLALVLTAGLSYSGIRDAFAAHEIGLNTLQGYERASQIEPGNPNNWYLLGRYWQYNLENPGARKAIRAYRKALSFDPRSAETWMDLAAVYESTGETAEARGAFLQAKHVYPLSPEVTWRYGNFLLRQGDTDAAFAQIRHSVEVDPKRGGAALILCLRVQPDFNSALDKVLPRTQAAYLSALSALTDLERADQALVVWSRLASLHPQFPLSESYPFLEVLIHKLQMADAARVWIQALAFAGVKPPGGPPGSLIWDGGFESGIEGGGLAWRYPHLVSGVQIDLDPKVKHSGQQSLRLIFGGFQNVDFADVCQFVPVQSGTSYQFSAWVRTESLSTDQGVRFSLQSLSGTNNSIVRTDDVHGTAPWTQVNLAWTSGKDVQELRLCVNRVPSAQFNSKISGSAWIDDVDLVRAPAESGRP